MLTCAMTKPTNQTTCFDCNAPFPVHPLGYTGGSGYATLDNGQQICYICADKRQIEDLKDRSRPFTGYVGEGVITTWTGGKLMTITRSRPCKLTRQSYTHSQKGYMSIHAVDVHGGHWSGRGSKGIAITLRPVSAR